MPLSRVVVFLSVVSAVLFGAHRYVWSRMVVEPALPAPWDALATGLVWAGALSMVAGMVAPRLLRRRPPALLSWGAFVWMGLMAFLLVLLGAGDLVAWAVGKAHASAPAAAGSLEAARVKAGFAGVGAALLALAGLFSALRAPPVKRVEVRLDKLRGPPRRIVQISDIHVGPTIGRPFVESLVSRINALEPDAVLITGDLVDGSVESLREHVAPLAGLKAREGVFFVTGNHEYYAGAEAWVRHLPTLGIRVLRNERVALEAFDLAGVDDAHAFGHGHGPDLPKALSGRDDGRAVVLMAHQPLAVKEAAALGVDLQLSGHTHGGQFIPWNFLVRLQQPYVAGLVRHGPTTLYVSRGTGYWGPPMRVGAPAEITLLSLIPSEPAVG